MATTDARLAAPAAPGSRLFETVLPMLRALLWAVSGFVTAAWLTALIAGSDLTAELPVTIGYVFAIAGWVLGGGAWEGWVVPWFGWPSTWDESEGIARYFRFATDHKVIGLQYLWAAIFAFGIAGVMAMAMRLEFISPGLSTEERRVGKDGVSTCSSRWSPVH